MDDNRGSVYLPEEVVTEILQRLHIKGLFRFKCVSKQWKSIISDPKFKQCYYQQQAKSPLSLLIVQPNELSDIKLDEVDPSQPLLYMPQSPSSNHILFDRIMASSNGLILSIRLSNFSSKGDLQYELEISISNPLTKQSASLSLLTFPATNWAFGFATRPAHPRGVDNPSYLTYKVVLIRRTWPHLPHADSSDITIRTFSSDTGSWTTKELISCPKSVLRCSDGDAKGILYWFDWDNRSIVNYDPYDSPDRFGRILMPSISGKILENLGMNLIHFGHQELLKFGEIEVNFDDNDRRLLVWRLVDHAKGEWSLERRCVISPFWENNQLRCWRKLVAPDPCNGELYCCFCYGDENRMKAIDIGTAKEVFADPNSKVVRIRETPSSPVTNQLVSIALCPWSSPFYGSTRSNSSSIVGFKMISNVWFPCFSNH